MYSISQDIGSVEACRLQSLSEETAADDYSKRPSSPFPHTLSTQSTFALTKCLQNKSSILFLVLTEANLPLETIQTCLNLTELNFSVFSLILVITIF